MARNVVPAAFGTCRKISGMAWASKGRVAEVPFAKLVFGGRRCAEQVLDEVVPATSHHIGFVAEAMPTVGEDDQVEILVGLDQRVDDEERVVRGDVAVH